jgi:hypothetical protein
MNTNGLVKLYDRLTPKERLPLIMAASARGDEAERNRLAHTAPREGFWIRDYYGWAEGLHQASMFHLLELLDAAALYWQVGGILAEWAALTEGEEDTPTKRLRATVKAFAYLLTIKIDGWKRFCSEFNVDSDMLIKNLPGFATVQRTEEAARLTAFTPDEANAWVRQLGGETAEVPTAEDVAVSLSEFVKGWAKRWD